jgi:outer membrane immunogenic protein
LGFLVAFGCLRSLQRDKLAFPLLSAALLLSSQSAYAAPPTGCDPLISVPGFGGNYFSNNVDVSPAISGPAGTAVAAVEATTSIATEQVALRRVQEAQICPAGTTKIDGVCKPVARKPAEPRRSTSSRTAVTGPKQYLKSQPSDESQPFTGSNAVWAQAFTDYEQRSGLGTSAVPASRSQLTSGLLFGADHTFQSGSSQVLLGALGGLSDTTQKFGSSSSGLQLTSYTAFTNFGLGPTIEYQVLDNHAIQNQETQTLKGGSLGLTASVNRGGFFSDTVAKVDLLNLNRTSTNSNSYDQTLNFLEKTQNPVLTGFGVDRGCITVGNRSLGQVLKTAHSLPFPSNPQTITTGNLQSTPQQNFILADNVGYHFDLKSGYWIEPLVGFQYTYTTYGSNASDLGLTDGQALRLQGGARLGVNRPVSDGGVWTGSFTAVLYSDVYIHGWTTSADAFSSGAVLQDQGKIRVEGILTSTLQLANGLFTFVEVQGRGGSDYWGVGGRVGARYEFFQGTFPVTASALEAQASMERPSEALLYNWTGLYAGGNLGYGWGVSSGSETFVDSGTGRLVNSLTDKFNMDGIIGGAQIGYNWQMSRWVFGLETDLQGSNQKGTGSFLCPGGNAAGTTLAALNGACTPGHLGVSAVPFGFGGFLAPVPQVNVPGFPVTGNLSENLKWFGTLRGRIGATVAPTTLLYLTGGLALGEVSTNHTVTGVNVIGPQQNNSVVSLPVAGSLSNTNTKVGWAVGAGVETSVYQNWTAKLEYLYLDLGTVTGAVSPFIAPSGGVIVASYCSHITNNVLRVGLNYHFGGPL